jgi:hypothetical protein
MRPLQISSLVQVSVHRNKKKNKETGFLNYYVSNKKEVATDLAPGGLGA